MELSSDTTNLLRPNQISDAQEELGRLDGMLNAPPHLRSRISDVGELRKRQKNLKAELEKYTPRKYSESERDAAVLEFSTLAKKIADGMPSSEEMRRNPPGAVGKNIAWQNRTKTAVARYKHIAMRLMAGGDVPDSLRNAGDIANIERLRPLKTVQDVSMDYAQIPQATNFHFGADVAGTVLFSAEEMEVLTAKAPAVAGSLAVLDNDARAEIKRLLGSLMAVAPKVEPVVKAEKPALHDLTYNKMKSMAASAGIDCKNVTKNDLITKLRDRHLIE